MSNRSLGHLGSIDPANWRDVPDYMLGPWWVGDVDPSDYVDPSKYGNQDFHGRFHPAIPYVAMLRFTKPGDVVWDMFAGGGTTIDVGIELDRRVVATDLHPTRSDIIEMDVSASNDNVHSIVGVPVDLCIMHPPYMGIIDYDSPMSTVDTVDAFKYEFNKCLWSAHYALKPLHVLVVVIGEVWVYGRLIPLDCILYDLIARDYGYRMIGRIVKDYGKMTQGGASGASKNTNLWKYRLLKYGYFRYGIDTVMFFQRPEDTR